MPVGVGPGKPTTSSSGKSLVLTVATKHQSHAFNASQGVQRTASGGEEVGGGGAGNGRVGDVDGGGGGGLDQQRQGGDLGDGRKHLDEYVVRNSIH